MALRITKPQHEHPADVHLRIEERAYYLWQNQDGERWHEPLANWLAAEQVEQTLMATPKTARAPKTPKTEAAAIPAVTAAPEPASAVEKPTKKPRAKAKAV